MDCMAMVVVMHTLPIGMPATMVQIIVVVGIWMFIITTVINFCLFIQLTMVNICKLLGQLLKPSHDGGQIGVGGGVGCLHVPECHTGFKLSGFKLSKVLVGDLNILCKRIYLQPDLPLKMLNDPLRARRMLHGVGGGPIVSAREKRKKD